MVNGIDRVTPSEGNSWNIDSPDEDDMMSLLMQEAGLAMEASQKEANTILLANEKKDHADAQVTQEESNVAQEESNVATEESNVTQSNSQAAGAEGKVEE